MSTLTKSLNVFMTMWSPSTTKTLKTHCFEYGQEMWTWKPGIVSVPESFGFATIYPVTILFSSHDFQILSSNAEGSTVSASPIPTPLGADIDLQSQALHEASESWSQAPMEFILISIPSHHVRVSKGSPLPLLGWINRFDCLSGRFSHCISWLDSWGICGWGFTRGLSDRICWLVSGRFSSWLASGNLLLVVQSTDLRVRWWVDL